MEIQSILSATLMAILGLMIVHHYVDQQIEARARQRMREAFYNTSPQDDGCFTSLVFVAFLILVTMLIVRG